MDDITNNLTHHEWRVRISCCNALTDLLRANVRINLAQCAPELLKKLFRVMDDIHEGTRLAATSTTKALSRVSLNIEVMYLLWKEVFFCININIYINNNIGLRSILRCYLWQRWRGSSTSNFTSIVRYWRY